MAMAALEFRPRARRGAACVMAAGQGERGVDLEAPPVDLLLSGRLNHVEADHGVVVEDNAAAARSRKVSRDPQQEALKRFGQASCSQTDRGSAVHRCTRCIKK